MGLLNTISGGVKLFLGLTDTPASFSGKGGELLRVNAGENAIEFINPVSFHAYKDVAQDIAASTWVQATWPIEVYDTNADFASDRFTPQVAGKYCLYTCVTIGAPDANSTFHAKITKNGVGNGIAYAVQRDTTTASETLFIVTGAEANGSTDYFEVFVYHNSVGTEILQGNLTINFGGFLMEAD